MLKVGITGGIGSGKSTVCMIFKCLGIPVYFADTEAKELYNTDHQLKSEIIKHFGEAVYEAGFFSAKKMRDIVFDSNEKLNLLNSLVHPKVKKHSDDWFAKQKASYAIKEAALLIESGTYQYLDLLILVKAPLEQRIKFVSHRDPFLTEEEIRNRISKQWPDEKKESYANFIINNDGAHALIPQVLSIHKRILNQVL